MRRDATTDYGEGYRDGWAAAVKVMVAQLRLVAMGLEGRDRAREAVVLRDAAAMAEKLEAPRDVGAPTGLEFRGG